MGYGPFPDRVVSFLQERLIASVRGNHDRWGRTAATPARAETSFGGGPPAIRRSLDYLRALTFDLVLPAHPAVVVVVHGSPRSDMEFVNRHSHPPEVLCQYLVELDCDLLVVGHHRTGRCGARCTDGLIVNPGSAVSIHGVDSSRTFALVDLDTLEVTFHDVESGGAVDVARWQ